jgi:hypothetical protein
MRCKPGAVLPGKPKPAVVFNGDPLMTLCSKMGLKISRLSGNGLPKGIKNNSLKKRNKFLSIVDKFMAKGYYYHVVKK